MMDKKMLLDNGLLEQYILGELNDAEAHEIEILLKSDSEVKAEFDHLEASFEQLGHDNAVNPPLDIKAQILRQIQTKSKAKQISQPTNYKSYFAIAASLVALLAAGSFWMYKELNTLENQMQVVEGTNEALNLQLEALEGSLEESAKIYAAVVHPDTQQYILEGNDTMPEAKVVSYVNHNTKSVIINAERLPELDTQHDYQMWADVEGEMINMGIIKKGKSLLAMNYIDRAESLNITIEPAGGKDHPTVERLISNVYLN